jgi:hypothetical protein
MPGPDAEQLMPLTLMLALQAAAVPAPALLDIHFDLARYGEVELGLGGGACRRDPSEITVCARRSGGAYPLEEMARIVEPERLLAETRIAGNLTGAVRVESAPMDRGAVGNRVLVGLRLPF